MSRRSNQLNHSEMRVVAADIIPDKFDYDELLQLFLQDANLRNLRSHTITYYQNELRAFRKTLDALEINTTPAKITTEHINEFIAYLKDIQGLKIVSINTRLRAVRAFFNFAYKHEYIAKNPCKSVKLLRDRRKVIETFSRDQINKLLNAPDLKTFTGVRDYTILLLLLETGVRANELVGITTEDIRWEDSTILIRNTKGHRERLVPFQSKMKTQLKKYLAIRGVCECDALFVTIDGTPLSKRQLQSRVTYYGEKAKINNVRVSCHTFRHTFAKLCVKQGAGIFELQQILGHTSMEMVRVYVNLYSDDVKEKHKQFSPLKYIR
ncbi:tyrosine-type recombinase/integrase [Cytobacillus oceanisediminis]|uniref:tyrosine-type recombinase/integrase n=1 Tax=Cytobacillus oceanisediminis TaxID=665099 RepID=UPI00255071C8|nr:tyrosine-type recombinase/integrase [Cytobacillus oceanisediminis]MDK7669539.1 tyrosine-type recombinase/integrase [Cytobacillus oceanisediminis]